MAELRENERSSGNRSIRVIRVSSRFRANELPRFPDNGTRSFPKEIVPEKEKFLKCPRGLVGNLDIQANKEFHLPRRLRTCLTRSKRADTNYFPRGGDCFVPRDFIGYTSIAVFFLARSVPLRHPFAVHTHVAICMRRTALCAR